jgi:hypothetical protein
MGGSKIGLDAMRKRKIPGSTSNWTLVLSFSLYYSQCNYWTTSKCVLYVKFHAITELPQYVYCMSNSMSLLNYLNTCTVCQIPCHYWTTSICVLYVKFHAITELPQYVYCMSNSVTLHPVLFMIWGTNYSLKNDILEFKVCGTINLDSL